MPTEQKHVRSRSGVDLVKRRHKTACVRDVASVVACIRALAPLTIAVMVGGCPVPVFQEAPFKPDVTAPITIGESDRADVLSTLGEPDEVFAGERLFVYEETQTHFLLLVGGGYAGAGALPVYSDHVLFVEFDEANTVQAVDAISAPFVAAKNEYCMVDGICISLRDAPVGAEAESGRAPHEIAALAQDGDARAQFDMYAMSDSLKDGGYLWLCRSAANGYPMARFSLMRHFLGQGPEKRQPDYEAAYVWLAFFEQLSGGQAEDLIQIYRDEIEAGLSSEDRAAAENQVSRGTPDPSACAARAAERVSRGSKLL